MKTLKYKIVGLLVLFAIVAQAQKYDKKVTEKFKVNKDVTVEINASHTDVDIETWNKNEVLVEAFIEVEGVDKEEANKIATINFFRRERNFLNDDHCFQRRS